MNTKATTPPLPGHPLNQWSDVERNTLRTYGQTCEEHGYLRGLAEAMASVAALVPPDLASILEEAASNPHYQRHEYKEWMKRASDALHAIFKCTEALAAHPTEQAAPADPLQELVDQAQELGMGYGAAPVQEAQAVDLRNCPFCDSRLIGDGFYTHPKADCFFSEWEFDNLNAEHWNRRAVIASIQPVREPLQGWISVDDRLPKCSKKPNSFGIQVLIWPPMKAEGCSEMASAFYGCRQTDKPNFYMFGRVLDNVTHWKPLPVGPVVITATKDGA